MRHFAVAGSLLALLAFAGCGGGDSRPSASAPPRTPPPAAAGPTPAQQLAVLSTGVPDPQLTSSYDAVLDRMQPKCREPREQIASDAWGSHRILLEDKRIHESALIILTRVANKLAGNRARTGCRAVFASYVAFRETGR